MNDEKTNDKSAISGSTPPDCSVCHKCNGTGFVPWFMLDDYSGPALENGVDDTDYVCDSCSSQNAIVTGSKQPEKGLE